MFKPVMNLISGSPPIAPPKDHVSFEVEGGEAVEEGSVVEIDANEEINTAAATTNTAALIALEDGDEGEFIRCYWITPGTVFKVPFTTHGNAVLYRGQDTAQLMADGLAVSDEDAGGHLTVIRVDRTNEFAWVVFNSGLLFHD